LLRDAYKLLSGSGINFAGNVEPYCRTHDHDKGLAGSQRPVDVVVQDGYPGNEYIKVFADGAEFTADLVKDELKQGGMIEKLGALLMRGVFKRVKKRIEPGQYGGAPFLGLNAPVFKGHGTTNEAGIVVGLEKYIRYVEKGFIQKVKEALAKPAVYANGIRS
jgi:glycerol-3-phosphate acyltransferase PlsX